MSAVWELHIAGVLHIAGAPPHSLSLPHSNQISDTRISVRVRPLDSKKELTGFFKALAVWANAFYKSICPYVCVSVCLCVCESVHF